MKKINIHDALSWESFFNGSKDRNFYPPKKAALFNRLIAHTNNFFVIAALGAFTPGYVMIVTKKLIPSLNQISDDQLDELNWLIEIIKKNLKEIYKKEVAIFEHGMCACVGGLDRAHLHLITFPNSADDDLIKETINEVLIKRRTGIKSIELNGYKLENIHDINEIMMEGNLSSLKIEGRQLLFDDIKNNIDIENWPISTRNHTLKGGHYVYFKTDSFNSSFLTNRNFQTQFGRQLIYELELKINSNLKEMHDKIMKENIHANIWKWQEYSFNENILKTMKDLIPAMLKIQINNKFNFQTFKKK